MKLRLLVPALIVALTICLFTSCGGSSDISDAKSLVEANKTAQEAVTSFHMDSDMDMEIGMNMAGLEAILGTSSLNMPMELKMSMDMGKESAHGDTSVSVSMMGQKQNVDAETYIDLKEGLIYSKAAGTDTWAKTEQDASSVDMAGKLSGMGDEILSKAEFASDESSYKLTLSAEDLGASIEDLGLLNDIGSSGVELKDFSMTEGEVVYTFDKAKVLLQKIDMDDVKVKATGSMQGTTVDMDITMEADYEFSKYDGLEPKDYEIPDEVKNGSSDQTPAPAPSTQATRSPQTTQATDTDPLPKATTQLIVSGASTPEGRGWYVVGEDSIPAGSYKLFHGDGRGVLTIKSANHRETRGEWSTGFGSVSADKDFEDGTRLDLVYGDLIFITKDLNVVFDPVN